MFWTEDSPNKDGFTVSDDVVDISYKLDAKSLPLDHAWALSQALQKVLPWLAEEAQAGVHLIHVAESGNGWYRPDDPENDVLYLSRRTRMTLRVPKHRIDDAMKLNGQSLDIDGHELGIKEASVKLFSSLPTLFARYVIAADVNDEMKFLYNMANELKTLGIPTKKLMAGKQNVMRMPQGPVSTRSLMIADLTPEFSVKLQQIGLGPGRLHGCGLFVPQKGIKPVKTEGE